MSTFFQVKFLHTMKVNKEELSLILTQNVLDMAELFSKRGYEIRVTGGAVRDLLMGNKFTDLDFATTATPEQMKVMFTDENIRMLNPRGELHGTITTRYNEENFEFSTLRVNYFSDDGVKHHNYVLDWALDAERRDLTMNSLFLGLDGTVYDYFNGIEHIKEKKIQFVVDPDIRIKEDYLRILRYFRFYGKFALKPDNHDILTLESIKRNVSGLAGIKSERLLKEFKDILNGNYKVELLNKMKECGIFPYIGLPENFQMKKFENLYNTLSKNNQLLNEINNVTLLASGFNDIVECETYATKMKISNIERDLLFTILKRRDEVSDNIDLKFIQDLFIDMILVEKKTTPLAKTYVSELLRYCCNSTLLTEFENSELPKYPVKGSKLRNIVLRKRDITKVNLHLVELWKKSHFILSENELLLSLKENDLCNSEILINIVNREEEETQ